MKKREPGFLGLAKQNAKRKGTVKVPRQHNIQGQAHYPVFVTAKEMQTLKDGGGTGEMTKYDIPAFPAYNPGGTEKSSSDKISNALDKASSALKQAPKTLCSASKLYGGSLSKEIWLTAWAIF